MATLLLSIPGNPAPGANLPKLPRPVTAITSDTFTGGDVSDIDGRMTDAALGGVPMEWSSGPANSYAISSGRLVRGSANTGISGAALNVGTGNIRMTAVLGALPSTNLYLDIRKATPDLGAAVTSCYRLRVSSTGTVELQRKPVSGSADVISTGTHTIGGTDTVGLEIYGGDLSIMINGDVVETVHDNSPLTGGWFEIYQGNAATLNLVSIKFDAVG